MSLIKKGISALLFTGLIMSCDDDGFEPIEPVDSSGGSIESVFSSFDVSTGGDGTIVTVKPLSVGVDSYIIDFGDGSTPVTALQGESVTYDYSNVEASTDYTITVTTKAAGQSDLTKTEDITVEHTVQSIDSAPSSPEVKKYNLLNIFTDASSVGSAGTGGKAVVLESGNNLIEFSRLHSDTGIFALSDEVVAADAFYSGVGSNNIHFDVYSEFASGIDKLKITLVDSTNSTSHVIDNLDLIDGEWTGIDLDLATDFSSPVSQFETILFELGSTGMANDHATITVDNIYMSRMTGSTILNGDFEDGQDFWKWSTFTDGETNPFGSSSDGSNQDYDGVDSGSKTRGAKWSSSQSGGEFRTASSRYAYQELNLVPGADYVLEYQYAIKDDSGTDPVGGRKVVGLILDGQYDDGADAVDNLGDNLGFNEGFVAEGKFSDTTDGAGTLVQIPFTANSSGEIAIMFYAVTPKDAFIDNVKVRSVNP
ncbi:hypothetical protein LCGC14_0165720 [marine sediment metagenome]|uniref:PKD domain-containing protein n=1 Tax=marine sediment metagenome TaxID=412755 RepID=A0A0F9V9S3_9ZZZZ|nr:hypothetical protein [Maribacter sp.]HDZ07191.1 hypothetical protein [Maribacter sp.]HEA78907.1 hypothetical protein [Maribacter sp.]